MGKQTTKTGLVIIIAKGRSYKQTHLKKKTVLKIQNCPAYEMKK